MPKEYSTQTGSEKGGTESGGAGKEERVKKTFGVYDKPVRAAPAMMIGIVVAVAIIMLIIVLLMMHR